MKLRTFHKLEGAETGLEVFSNWVSHDKSPIKDTDLSLIFNGEEYVDNSADYIALGKISIPCLTTDNLAIVCKQLNKLELTSIKKSLEIPDKETLKEWIQSPEIVQVLTELGFQRS